MTSKEVMQQALEALENHEGNYKLGNAGCDRQEKAITAIKEALAQPPLLEQEPVAMLERNPRMGILKVTYEDAVTDLEEGVYALYTQPQGWRDHVAQAYLKGFDEGERRYRWLRKEFSEGRETYVAESVSSENALDEYVDRQMAKTSIKTQRWSGK